MINDTNNQIIELSVNELEKISGGAIFDDGIFNRKPNPEDQRKEAEINANFQESQQGDVFVTLNALKSQAQAYM